MFSLTHTLGVYDYNLIYIIITYKLVIQFVTTNLNFEVGNFTLLTTIYLFNKDTRLDSRHRL